MAGEGADKGIGKRNAAVEEDRGVTSHGHQLKKLVSLADKRRAQLCGTRCSPEAETLAREVLQISSRVAGPDNPLTLQTQSTLAVIDKDRGNYAEAEVSIHKVREGVERVLSPKNQRIAQCTAMLARIAALQGEQDEALQLLRDALDQGLDPPTAQTIATDPDYKSLRATAKFQFILTGIRQKWPPPPAKRQRDAGI